jgi:hypothetical protein
LFFPPNVEQRGSDPAFEEMTLRIDRRIMLPMLFTVMLVKGEEQVTSESQYFAGGLRTGSILSDSQSGSIIFLDHSHIFKRSLPVQLARHQSIPVLITVLYLSCTSAFIMRSAHAPRPTLGFLDVTASQN